MNILVIVSIVGQSEFTGVVGGSSDVAASASFDGKSLSSTRNTPCLPSTRTLLDFLRKFIPTSGPELALPSKIIIPLVTSPS
jgi:hypothetical protein